MEGFFKEVFPDFYDLMPNVADHWQEHPLSALALIRCYPWTDGKMALMGDAAHATVPFFGQGMNCGFEDCTILWELMQQHQENWSVIFKEYEKDRKPNCDAMQDLSMQNYLVMRDEVNNPEFLLINRIEKLMAVMFSERYFPLYSMVSFSNIEYQYALKKGNAQQEAIRRFIQENSIADETSNEILETLLQKNFHVLIS